MPPAMLDLDPPRVAALLRTRRLGRPYHFHARCASTNALAAELADAGAPEGTLVVADAQDAGRGRHGRAWFSPSGENLYLSLVLRPAVPPPALPPLTLLAGGAIAGALATLGLVPRLKWPNDVLLAVADPATTSSSRAPAPIAPVARAASSGRLRKVCGVLLEMATAGGAVRHAIVGVGLNVNTIAFPADLAERATSLRAHLGRAIDRGVLLADLLARLEPLYDRFVADGPAEAIALWRRFGLRGAPARVVTADGVVEGTMEDLDDQGALILLRADGTRARILSGEVQ